jgi:hypothetical protein
MRFKYICISDVVNISMLSLCKVFQKDLHNATVWRVQRKRLHLKAYKLSIVQHLEQ